MGTSFMKNEIGFAVCVEILQPIVSAQSTGTPVRGSTYMAGASALPLSRSHRDRHEARERAAWQGEKLANKKPASPRRPPRSVQPKEGSHQQQQQFLTKIPCDASTVLRSAAVAHLLLCAAACAATAACHAAAADAGAAACSAAAAAAACAAAAADAAATSCAVHEPAL